jgi:hypothetical protein
MTPKMSAERYHQIVKKNGWNKGACEAKDREQETKKLEPKIKKGYEHVLRSWKM